MRIINKSIDNGIIRINDLTFLQFSNAFIGYLVCSKKTGTIVPKFILFWKGLSVADVKQYFDLKRRGNDD